MGNNLISNNNGGVVRKPGDKASAKKHLRSLDISLRASGYSSKVMVRYR